MVAGDQSPGKALPALRFLPADAVASRGVPLSRARAGETAKGGRSNLSRMRAATGTRLSLGGCSAVSALDADRDGLSVGHVHLIPGAQPPREVGHGRVLRGHHASDTLGSNEGNPAGHRVHLLNPHPRTHPLPTAPAGRSPGSARAMPVATSAGGPPPPGGAISTASAAP